jgi:hypothetical protein
VVGHSPGRDPGSGAGDVDRSGTRPLPIGDSGQPLAVELSRLEAV